MGSLIGGIVKLTLWVRRGIIIRKWSFHFLTEDIFKTLIQFSELVMGQHIRGNSLPSSATSIFSPSQLLAWIPSNPSSQAHSGPSWPSTWTHEAFSTHFSCEPESHSSPTLTWQILSRMLYIIPKGPQSHLPLRGLQTKPDCSLQERPVNPPQGSSRPCCWALVQCKTPNKIDILSTNLIRVSGCIFLVCIHCENETTTTFATAAATGIEYWCKYIFIWSMLSEQESINTVLLINWTKLNWF